MHWGSPGTWETYLVDTIFPELSVRQRVPSFPWRLCCLLALDRGEKQLETESGVHQLGGGQ